MLEGSLDRPYSFLRSKLNKRQVARHLGHRQGQKLIFRRDLNVKEVL
jgi:hypothetical protein